MRRTRALPGGLGLILLAHLVLTLAYGVVVPLGEAPDEADHYYYIRFLGQQGRLPVGAEVTQGKHPPLYYAVASALTAWTGQDFSFLRSNPDASIAPGAPAPNFFVHTRLEDFPWHGGALAMHLARILSTLLSLGTLMLVYAIGQRLWPEQPWIALGSVAGLAFIPEFLFISGIVSNDSLAALTGALIIWAALVFCDHPTLKTAFALGAAIGLGLISKVSVASVGVAGLIAFWEVYQNWRAGFSLRRTYGKLKPARQGLGHLLSWLGAAALGFLLLGGWWIVRNLLTYGDPLGWPAVVGTVDRRLAPLSPADLLWLFRGWFLSFWGKFGAAGHIPMPGPIYLAFALLTLLAISSILLHVIRDRCYVLRFTFHVSPLTQTDNIASLEQNTHHAPRTTHHWLPWLALPILAVMLTMIQYSQVALGTDQGRLLYPALAPLALLGYAGLAMWLPSRWQRRAASGVALAGLALGLYALAGIIQPAYAAPAAQICRPPACPTDARGARFAGGLNLLGYDQQMEPTPDGQRLRLTLYWQASSPITQDLRTTVRIRAANSALLHESSRSPNLGRLSTDHWLPGATYADDYSFDLPTKNTVYWQVGVRAFPNGGWLPAENAAVDTIQ